MAYNNLTVFSEGAQRLSRNYPTESIKLSYVYPYATDLFGAAKTRHFSQVGWSG